MPDQTSGVKLSGEARARYVQTMFGRIARNYDLMNRLMTGGQDIRWRREVVRKAQIQPRARVLDVGAGTGDLTRESIRQQPQSWLVPVDFALPMLQAGRYTEIRGRNQTIADTLLLPFPDQTFDAVISGFLLRNVPDLEQALREQYRVLKTNGRWVCLDTTRPEQSWLSPMIHFHTHTIIPTLGRLLTGDREAYSYLPESTDNFLSVENLAGKLRATGFQQVEYRTYMANTIAIHWGVR